MKKLFQYLFLILGCLQLAGGPYALLQTYAWGSMLASYSQESGLVQAAKDTFSGEKPCHLCCKLAEAKKADASQQRGEAPAAPEKSGKLLQEIISAMLVDVSPPTGVDACTGISPAGFMAYRGWVVSPPAPPPRPVA